jgi:hypothetical protein
MVTFFALSSLASLVPACKSENPAVKTAPSAEAKAADDVVDHDLSAAGPTWAGWVAKGPKEAEVSATGENTARLVEPGMFDVFALDFTPTKGTMADVKEQHERSSKSMGTKLTYLVDTPDKLEYTEELGNTKTWYLDWHMKVAGKDVTCSSMKGARSEAAFAKLKAGCASLRKK